MTSVRRTFGWLLPVTVAVTAARQQWGSQGIYIGDYIGLAARGVSGGSRAYIHYTHTAITGTYNGVKDPEENNHLSRFDY